MRIAITNIVAEFITKHFLFYNSEAGEQRKNVEHIHPYSITKHEIKFHRTKRSIEGRKQNLAFRIAEQVINMIVKSNEWTLSLCSFILASLLHHKLGPINV